jgi:hypothetical protein
MFMYSITSFITQNKNDGFLKNKIQKRKGRKRKGCSTKIFFHYDFKY